MFSIFLSLTALHLIFISHLSTLGFGNTQLKVFCLLMAKACAR